MPSHLMVSLGFFHSLASRTFSQPVTDVDEASSSGAQPDATKSMIGRKRR